MQLCSCHKILLEQCFVTVVQYQVMKKKIVVIGGQTATGKTALAVKLAREFNGEIVSADSRQVYIAMDIGTGKDISRSKYQVLSVKKNLQIGFYETEGVKVWLYDVVKPDYQFNVGEYESLAREVIEDISKRGKIPFVVGGTGLYLRSLINTLNDTVVPPNQTLRQEMKDFSVVKLQNKLKEFDKEKLESLNNSDKNNPRRLTRAIEIASWKKNHQVQQKEMYDYTAIILENNEKQIKEKIANRVKKRMAEGMTEEVKSLLKKGYDFNLPSFSATGYQEIKDFLIGKVTKEEAIEEWLKAEVNYAKRQNVWLKKFLPLSEKVLWLEAQDKDLYKKSKKHLLKNP